MKPICLNYQSPDVKCGFSIDYLDEWSQDEITKKRKMEGLMETPDAFGIHEGLILAEDEEFELNIDGFIITVRPVWKWLLEHN